MATTPNIMTGDDLEILAGNKTTDDIPGDLNIAGTLTVGGVPIVPGGTGTPAGPVNSVQTNNSGVFAGSDQLIFDSSAGTLSIGNGSTQNGTVYVAGGGGSPGAIAVRDQNSAHSFTILGANTGTSGSGIYMRNSESVFGAQLLAGGIAAGFGGNLQLNSFEGNLRVDLAGNGGGVLNVDPGGAINLYNTGDQITVNLSAGHAGDGGGNVLSMLRSDGLANSGLYMGASNTSGEPSKLAMFQGLGDQTLTCEVYGGDGTTYGGRINLYGINNQGGIRIEGNTALTGDGNAFVGATGANSSVANIGVNFNTIGTGTLNFLAPVVFPLYLTTTLPTAPVGAQIFVSDANAGVGTMAFYNGTNWIDIKTGVTVVA